MEEKIRLLIREQVSKLFEHYFEDDGDSEYVSSFDFEDIKDAEPGGAAHKAFMRDLGKEKGKYTAPTDKEFQDLVNGMRQANLGLAGDEDLVRMAEKQLHRQLSPTEADKIMSLKKDMNRKFGVGSYNESAQ